MSWGALAASLLVGLFLGGLICLVFHLRWEAEARKRRADDPVWQADAVRQAGAAVERADQVADAKAVPLEFGRFPALLVTRVQVGSGWSVEPRSNPAWDRLTRLCWEAGVAAFDTGLKVEVYRTEDMGPDEFGLIVAGTSAAAFSFHEARNYLQGVAVGVASYRRQAEKAAPGTEKVDAGRDAHASHYGAGQHPEIKRVVHEPMPVVQVVDGDGKSWEPKFQGSWDEATKLRWRAGVAVAETGLRIVVLERPPSLGRRYGLQVGDSPEGGCWTFLEATTYLRGVSAAVREGDRLRAAAGCTCATGAGDGSAAGPTGQPGGATSTQRPWGSS